MKSSLPLVLLLGPARTAVSGVSTHLNQLFNSQLSTNFDFGQFQVGREGRAENRLGTLLRLIGSPFAFAFCVLQRRPQIVHINTSLDPKAFWRDLGYLLIAKALRRKVVYQVHGGALPQELFAGINWLTSLLQRSLSYPDAVVVLSERELAAYRKFAPNVDVVLIANAVEIEEVDLDCARYASNRVLEVVYIGRLATTKGVFDIVQAVALLTKRGTGVHLRLAGYGAAEQQLREAITKAELDDRVKLIGPVFGASKQQLWQSANVLAFPSHAEGLPYALLESMAAGVVPVITPVGAIPDVVDDRVHGVFVPPRSPEALADALEGLHRDRDALQRMAVAGRERIVARYSVGRLAADFRRLYTDLLMRNSA
jgi:glycosyltransferase involved in cell wall biosynthesis